MNKDTIIAVIKRLVGDIKPIADSEIDSKRFENLQLFISVFDEMHTILDEILHDYSDSPYHSQKIFSVECKKQLSHIGICDFHEFMFWSDKLNKDYINGKFMYIIDGHNKSLNVHDVFEYWLKNVWNQ